METWIQGVRSSTKALPLNDRLLPCVSRDAPVQLVKKITPTMLRLSGLPVVLHHVGLAKLTKEVLVVSNDDELEVRVTLALVDDTARRMVSTASDTT